MSKRSTWIVWIMVAAVAIIASKTFFGVNRLIEEGDRQARIMRATH